MASELSKLSAIQLATLIKAGEISPVDLIEAALTRIREVDGVLNACTVVLADEARARALCAERQVAAGDAVGPLHGVPVAVKDAIWVEGQSATMGSRALESFRPIEDAASVRRLRDAGAIIVAKTANSELLWSAYIATELHGVTRNPWNPERTPGGSSGGSAAAVASGMVSLALGTDAGGSIRLPAAFCGIVGVKPTHGLVARSPGFEEMRSLNVVGPLARSVADARLCLEIICGPDPADNLSVPLLKLDGAASTRPQERRVAWADHLGDHALEQSVKERFHSAVTSLANAGWQLEEASPEVSSFDEIWDPISSAEFAPMLDGPDNLLPAPLQDMVAEGARISATAYYAAQLRRAEFTRVVESFFDHYDALLTPTTAMAPFAANPQGPVMIAGASRDVDKDMSLFNLSLVANLTGGPAVALPIGFDGDGLPVSLQIMCRRFADGLAMDIAEQISLAIGPVVPLPVERIGG